jgi:uncharacterized protein
MMNKANETDINKSISQSRGAGDLQAIIAQAVNPDRGLPPVERWNPPFCGDIDMEVRADGTWFYMGTPIGRAPLVRLFSTVLRKDEDGKTYLVTPVEKVGIRIVDAPFVAVEMAVTEESGEQVLTLRTNVGDLVRVSNEHPLRFEIEKATGGLKPYVLVRGRLEAVFSRALMYDLVALCQDIEIDGVTWFAVRSCGAVFPVIESAKLAELSF